MDLQDGGPLNKRGKGSRLKTLAWEHADSMVKDYLARLATTSEDRQEQFEQPKIRGRLSVADTIVLHMQLGLSKAACFVSAVDPWHFPADADGDEAPSGSNIKGYVSHAMDQFAQKAKHLSVHSEASISAFLLSPLLVKKGMRPLLVRKTAAELTASLCASPATAAALGGATAFARLPSLSPAMVRPAHSDSDERRLGDDGLPYTRAEFDAFYSEDPEASADYWFAAIVVGAPPLMPSTPAPPTQRFPIGSVVRVLPDTRPGIRPELAEGVLAANLGNYSVDGAFCYVSPIGGRNVRRKVPANLIVAASVDAHGGFRTQGRGGSVARTLARAMGRAAKSAAGAYAEAEKRIKEAKSTAAVTVNRARKRVVKARADAAEAVESAEERRKIEVMLARADAARDVKRAEKLVRRALAGKAATEKSLKEKAEGAQKKSEDRACVLEEARAKEKAKAAEKLRKAKAAADKSEAEVRSIFNGGQDGLRLSKKGRAQAAAVFAEAATEIGRLERHAQHDRAQRSKAEAEAANALAAVEKQRELKNAAHAAKREAGKSASHAAAKAARVAGRSKCAVHKLPEGIQERLGLAQADVVAAEAVAEALAEENDELKETIAHLRSKLGEEERAAFDKLVLEHDTLVLERNKTGAVKSLIDHLGRSGEEYSQEIVELGFRLMSARLSGEQAVSVIRAFVTLLHSGQIEGLHYRIPSAKRFIEWRRYLEPICHFLAVSTIKLALRTHNSNDATTKKHVHLLMAVYRCELPGGVVVNVPTKFMVIPSGTAATEAATIFKEALHSDVAEGAHASHINCVSSCTDNAARATSAELKRLKVVEIAEAKLLIETHAAVPENMAHAVKCWQLLTPAQQEDAYEMHGLGCTGHSVNLTTDDSHKHSEIKAMADNMVRDRAARVLQRLFLTKLPRTAKPTAPHTFRIVFKGYSSLNGKAFVSGWKKESTARPGMSLLPAGKNLNGGDMPSASDTLYQTSKLFSSEGEHAAYYLNEARTFEVFARKCGIKYKPLLSFKGSRQNITVQQATRILFNLNGYLQYFDETRIESDPNELVLCVWNGLRDRYVLAALHARAFVDAGFTSPVVFFTHSDKVPDVTRPMIHQIMLGARAWIIELSHLGNIGSKSPPDVQYMANKILELLPALRPWYTLWWNETGKELISIHALATDPSFWPLVSAHLTAASPHMLATHDRNLDKDCRDISVLEHAPINTDSVESQFSHYDNVLKLGAGVGATTGVALSIATKSMATDGELRSRAEAAVEKKRKRGLGGDLAIEEQVTEKIAAWQTLSFFALPKGRRWDIICSVRRAYKKKVLADLELLRKMDEAKAARLKASRDEEITKHASRSLKHYKLAAVPLVATVAALAALVALHVGSPKKLVADLCQQIRLRIHVCGVPAPELPWIGAKPGATDLSEAERLHEAFKVIVAKPPPAKLPPPTPYPVRAAAAAPSELAKQLDVAHVSDVSRAWRELIAVLDGGAVFKAPKKKKKESAVPAAPSRQKKAKATAPTPAERALRGEEFEEEGVDWRVLCVRWHADVGKVVVWYYDIEEAGAAGVTEKHMGDAIESGDSYDCLEFSSVSEIKNWLKAAGKTS